MLWPALRYQSQGEGWVKRVAIGALVVALTVLFVPLWTLYGYMVEVMRRVVTGDASTPPQWGELDLVETTVDGLKYFAIVFVYTVVLGIPGTILAFLPGLLDLGALGGVVRLVGVQVIASLLVAVLTPVVVVNFAVEDDIVAAFDLTALRTVGTNRHMLGAIGLGVAVNVVVAFASGVLLVTVVGPPIVAFVGLSAVSVIWARGYADAYEDIHGERPTVAGGWTAPADSPTAAEPTATDVHAAGESGAEDGRD